MAISSGSRVLPAVDALSDEESLKVVNVKQVPKGPGVKRHAARQSSADRDYIRLAILAIGHRSGMAVKQCSSSDVRVGVIFGNVPPVGWYCCLSAAAFLLCCVCARAAIRRKSKPIFAKSLHGVT